jgi:putative membrane protein
VTAAAGLALVLTGAPTRLLHGQSTQDTAKKAPWVLPKSPSTPSTQATGQVVADSGFIREVASLNLLEVRLGTMAEQRSSNTAVKQFAKQIAFSHSTIERQWTSLAGQNGLPISVALSSIQQQSADQLSKLSGADFDRAYMNAMVVNHEQDAATLQRIGTNAQSAAVKQLAARGLATTQEHLSQARQLASQVGATTVVATNPPVSPGGVGARRPNDSDQANRADGVYARDMAYGHILEIRLAQMAQERAKRPQVKQFASRVASGFPKWQERWTDLASKHGGVKVHPDMGPVHRQRITQLEHASGSNFDQVYLNIVVEELGFMVPQLQKERAARSADVRNTVDEELPFVQENLSAAQQLDRQLQANANTNANANAKGKEKEKGKSVSSKE